DQTSRRLLPRLDPAAWSTAGNPSDSHIPAAPPRSRRKAGQAKKSGTGALLVISGVFASSDLISAVRIPSGSLFAAVRSDDRPTPTPSDSRFPRAIRSGRRAGPTARFDLAIPVSARLRLDSLAQANSLAHRSATATTTIAHLKCRDRVAKGSSSAIALPPER